MPTKRVKPYIWTTWLPRLMSGDSSCEWSAQFKSNYESKSYAKVSNGFDSAKWQMEHTALLNQVMLDLESQSSVVYTEGQNYFTLPGKTATLAGKPDLVTVDGSTGLIIDAKSGQQSAAHQIQILIYMYALPKALPQYRNVEFEGRLVYPNDEVIIPSHGVNDAFVSRLGALIRTLAGVTPARKVPSFQECNFCNITSADCLERVEDEIAFANLTDDF